MVQIFGGEEARFVFHENLDFRGENKPAGKWQILKKTVSKRVFIVYFIVLYLNAKMFAHFV